MRLISGLNMNFFFRERVSNLSFSHCSFEVQALEAKIYIQYTNKFEYIKGKNIVYFWRSPSLLRFKTYRFQNWQWQTVVFFGAFR